MNGNVNFKPKKPFLAIIDSDGSLVDSIYFKHSECYIPQFVAVFGLQPICRLARELWENVNIKGATRGIHRFAGLIQVLDKLQSYKEITSLDITLPDPDPLYGWLAATQTLSHQKLEQDVQSNSYLLPLYEWSIWVNEVYERLLGEQWLFPTVAEAIERLKEDADLVLFNDTPQKWLQLEWENSEGALWFGAIIGEEAGSKKEVVSTLVSHTEYNPQQVLVIGDSLVDYRAAKTVGAMFFPIVPAQEAISWKWLLEEGIELFINGKYNVGLEDEWLTRLKSVFIE